MLKWNNSKIGRYKIINTQKEKFIVDTFRSTPKILLFATSPDIVKFKMFKISANNNAFNKNKSKASIGTLTVVLITQPFVTFIYNLGKQLFINYSVNESSFFKVSLFILSVILSIGVYIFISKIDEYRLKKIGGIQITDYSHELMIKTNGKKNYSIISFLVLLIILLFIYLKSQDGSEAVILCLVSLITFGFMIISRYIAQSNYKELKYKIREIGTSDKK
ncbi:hypothetical protein [Enterococcus faecalis]|uniref:hypothetical protein n=1 Tax=Enterococcus TaxID=1350 RepID=UPI0007102BAB|nr:hypothetical protein [Enterococcus faecalis]KXF71673.1 hypothetical protein AQ486_03565 [Enterococcus faecalis]KXF73974.1 hypothetical protein AQ487_03915 [Enterococcus faecalis]MBC2812579.1 hypothetical protein [Enterococcus faecalis]MBC2816479.1 hypothetical protein [Enterococcus faecalis]MBC2819502.1 hypothetical protein [Enterococcus faecalis]